jgi:hypothetical protein
MYALRSSNSLRPITFCEIVLKKVTQVCDEYFHMHRFEGMYCDGEKNHHHHIVVMEIVAEHRQVIHCD